MAITRESLAQPKSAAPPEAAPPGVPQSERTLLEAEQAYRRGTVTIHDIIAPSVMRVMPSHLELSGKFVRTLFVTTYPRYISVGWFAPIINYPTTLDISMYFYPVDSAVVLKQLRNQVGNLQAQMSANTEKGAPRDPKLETAIRDIEELRDNLTTGTEKFFQFALYVTLYAPTLEELDSLTEKVESIFGTAAVYTRRALWQAEQGYNSTLPISQDSLDISFNMNSSPIASSFPFISSELTSDQGILYGINLHNNSLIIFDRFSLQNANTVVFATSGAGKSVDRNTEVLIKARDGSVERVAIGGLVDRLGAERGFEKIDEELEGVVDPGISVYTFNRELKGEWSRVTVAARKDAPSSVYRFVTKSGREITVTGDHNMLVFRGGRVVAAKSEEVRVGESIPVPRELPEPSTPTDTLDLYELIGGSRYLYITGAHHLIARHKEKLRSIQVNPKYDRYLPKYCEGRRIPITYFLQLCARLTIDRYNPSIRITARHGNGAPLPARFPVTEEFARLLGYLVSEGCVADRYHIITNEDEEVRNDIHACARACGFSYFQRQDGTFIFASRALFEFFVALGIVGKAGDKRIPSFLFNTSNSIVAAFLRAYFEGDGGVERNTVNACSKSKHLVSDLSYMLLRFGIVSRLFSRTKSATNGRAHGTYHLLAISGQEHLTRFAAHINFLSDRKRARLSQVTGKDGNTNVDTIPVQDIMCELYGCFASQLHGLQDVVDIKNGCFQPSRAMLHRVIAGIEERVARFEAMEDQFASLAELPSIASIVEHSSERSVNSKLWSALGQSWRLMRNGAVAPRAQNVFKAIEVCGGPSYALHEMKERIHDGFLAFDIPHQSCGRSLTSALLLNNRFQNTSYDLLRTGALLVWEEYERTARSLPRVRECLRRLHALADADLLWDPIVSIEKRSNTDEYVYDLTVDNEVFFAGHGGLFVHNSYAIKLEVLRSLMMGTTIIVIDPEMEYKHLSDAVGGTYINVSLGSEAHINPFDLPRPTDKTASVEDIIRSAVIAIKGLLRIMLGKLTTQEDSLLDRALLETYRKRDITPTSDLTKVQSPTLSDLQEILEGMEGTNDLQLRLKKYTEGTFAGLLNNPTNIDMKNQLVVFSVRDLEDELRPIAIYTIINYIWNAVRSELKKRVLVVDEAWWLMQHDDSAKFMYALVKRCRKYYLGVTTITQDVNDFLLSPYGQAIVNNSALQLLLRQSQASIDLVSKTFLLTEGERLLLLDAEVGNGIFFAGSKHVAIRVIASYTEDQLITSDPRQLLEIERAKREFKAERGGDELEIG